MLLLLHMVTYHLPFFCVCVTYLFIWKAELQSDIIIFHLLVHAQIVAIASGRPIQKQGPGASTGSPPPWTAGAHTLGPSSVALPRPLGSWMAGRAARTCTCAITGCQCHRWCFLLSAAICSVLQLGSCSPRFYSVFLQKGLT